MLQSLQNFVRIATPAPKDKSDLSQSRLFTRMIMAESEQHIINLEHFQEVFEFDPPKFPEALRLAVNPDVPDYYVWAKIQPALAYMLEGYEPETVSHSTTPSKRRKRVRQLMHPEGPSRFKRQILNRMFIDTRRLYIDARAGRASSDDMSKLLLSNGRTLLRDMPIGAQEAHREVFSKVFLGGFFKQLRDF